MTSTPGAEGKGGLFPELDAEDDSGITEIESLCMYCHEQVNH